MTRRDLLKKAAGCTAAGAVGVSVGHRLARAEERPVAKENPLCGRMRDLESRAVSAESALLALGCTVRRVPLFVPLSRLDVPEHSVVHVSYDEPDATRRVFLKPEGAFAWSDVPDHVAEVIECQEELA